MNVFWKIIKYGNSNKLFVGHPVSLCSRHKILNYFSLIQVHGGRTPKIRIGKNHKIYDFGMWHTKDLCILSTSIIILGGPLTPNSHELQTRPDQTTEFEPSFSRAVSWLDLGKTPQTACLLIIPLNSLNQKSLWQDLSTLWIA